jgi:hypothetical protein
MKRNKKYTLQEFIDRGNIIHNYGFDYSLIREYENNKTRVPLICKTCGHLFSVTPDNHLNRKSGCPKCVGQVKTTNDIVKEFVSKHGENTYDYSKVVYKNVDSPVIIIQKNDNKEILITPKNHLRSLGEYSGSKLEKIVDGILNKMGIVYKKYENFEWLRYKKPLELDFYLPDYNIAIEIQGRQHFEPVEVFGGENEFKNIQQRDKIKKQLCDDNGVKLLYFSCEKNGVPNEYLDEVIVDENVLIQKIKDNN